MGYDKQQNKNKLASYATRKDIDFLTLEELEKELGLYLRSFILHYNKSPQYKLPYKNNAQIYDFLSDLSNPMMRFFLYLLYSRKNFSFTYYNKQKIYKYTPNSSNTNRVIAFNGESFESFLNRGKQYQILVRELVRIFRINNYEFFQCSTKLSSYRVLNTSKLLVTDF